MDLDHPPSHPVKQPWSFPFALQVGVTGFGIGVGCGVGVGVGSPINLHGIPLLGQMAAGISAGLGSLGGGALSGMGQKARQRLRATGIKGLDAGAGCGVGIGYGFGAGLVLKPGAAERAVGAARGAAAAVVARLPPQLQAALTAQGGEGGPHRQAGVQLGMQPYHHTAAAAAAAPHAATGAFLAPQTAPATAGAPTTLQGQQQVVGGTTPGGATGSNSGSGGGGNGDDAGMLLRAVLRQNDAIEELRDETRQLREALCKVAPDAAVCVSSSGAAKGEKQQRRR